MRKAGESYTIEKPEIKLETTRSEYKGKGRKIKQDKK